MLITVCLVLRLVQSITYYVDGQKRNSGNGQSWDESYKQLSEALSVALNGDNIWIKGGQTYTPPSNSNRDQCFIVKEGIGLYGGFDGTESFLFERSNVETVISGNIGNTNQNTDNCYHVLTYNKSITLDSLTISDGYANFEYDGPETRPYLNGYGGALITSDITQQQTVVITNVTFSDNTGFGGGALWFGASNTHTVTVIITHCHFVNNRAINGRYEGGYGGGIYVYFQVNISVSDTIFDRNYATFKGGALYQDYGGTLQCNNCEFVNNEAFAAGGAIFAENRGSSTGTFPEILDSDFSINIALILGAAMTVVHGVQASVTFATQFTQNTADYGGAVAIIDSNISPLTADYYQNTALQDSSTNDVYFEHFNSIAIKSVDDTLTFNINSSLQNIWQQYQNTKAEFFDPLFPFDPNAPLCYVNIDNTNRNQDGYSWNGAYNNLQDCLQQLQSTGGEIWVKGSAINKYKPTLIDWVSKPSIRDIDKSFLMYDGIRLYGGFSGNEENRDDRDITANPTYLSGNLGSSRVVNLLYAANDVVIDGFIFEEAGCFTDYIDSDDAGGCLVADNMNVAVLNTIFHKCCSRKDGGAMFCSGPAGYSLIWNTFFMGNVASMSGGGIYGMQRCSFECKWCEFYNNGATKYGGGVYLTGNSYATFESARFEENYALDSGGCVGVSQQSYATLDCGIFYNNNAKWEGGCLYAGAGDLIQKRNYDSDTDHIQGFIIYADQFRTTFIGNYLTNMDITDRGQPDIYLWPYTDLLWNDKTCGAPPTPGPTSIFIECLTGGFQPSITGSCDETPLSFEFRLQPDHFFTQIKFSTCRSDFDTYLTLAAESGLIIDECDDCSNLFTNQLGDCDNLGISGGPSNDGECCFGGVQGTSELLFYDLNKPGTYHLHLSKGNGDLCNGNYVLDIHCALQASSDPTPSPTTAPTASPIYRRWLTKNSDDYKYRWPSPPDHDLIPSDECTHRCDAFSVSVQSWYTAGDNVCIRYNVQRLISNGYYCNDNIVYLILGICETDSNKGISPNDLMGLIQYFEVLNINDRTKLRTTYTRKAWGTNSDSVYGILINVPVENEVLFEICLTNVFDSELQFSDIVRFRRGYNKYTCSGEFMTGLPCLNYDIFLDGTYENSGFNRGTQRYSNYYTKSKKRRSGKRARNRAVSDNDKLDITELEAKDVVRWQVLSCIISFGLCVIGCCIYCCILKKKREETNGRDETGDRKIVKSYEVEDSDDDSLDAVSDTKKDTFKRNRNTTVDDGIEMQNFNTNTSETSEESGEYI